MHTFYKLNISTLDDYFKIKEEVSHHLALIKMESIYEKFVDFSYEHYTFNYFYEEKKASYYPDIVDSLLRLQVINYNNNIGRVTKLLLTCLAERKDNSPLSLLDFFEEVTNHLAKQSEIIAFTPRSSYRIRELKGNYYLELLDMSISHEFLKWSNTNPKITEFKQLDLETQEKLITLKLKEDDPSRKNEISFINEVKFDNIMNFSKEKFIHYWFSYGWTAYRFYRECYINSQGVIRGKEFEEKGKQQGSSFTHQDFSRIRRQIVNDYNTACENNDNTILKGLPSMEDILNFTLFERTVTF